MNENTPRPFSLEFVLNTTVNNMKRDIDISIRKTFERIGEFADNPVKSREVLTTLFALHNMKKQINVFKHQDTNQ
jgi:hypothetical protein